MLQEETDGEVMQNGRRKKNKEMKQKNKWLGVIDC